MRNKAIRIAAVILLVGGIFLIRGGADYFRGSTVEAVGDLSVDFGVAPGSPIFNVSNMSPGDSESKSVIVINDAPTDRMVGVRGIKTAETAHLSDALTIVITQGGTDLYGGTSGAKTLSEFFTESAHPNGIPLSNLAPGASTSFTFTVTFEAGAGNEYQAAQVIFDLKIGISIELPPECEALDLTGSPIFGTKRNDSLIGTNGNDLIIGFEGNDSIVGRGGDDCIIGGPGNDSITAGAGDDAVFGGEGNDSILGEQGNDYIEGNGGHDVISGGDGHDVIKGGAGRDTITGGNGDDYIEGNEDNDTLVGDNGNDTLLGGAGFDTVTGNAGVDTCEGEVKVTCEL